MPGARIASADVIDDEVLRAEYADRVIELRAVERQVDVAIHALGLRDVIVLVRIKAFENVLVKLRAKGSGSLDDVADLLAFRVIVPAVADLEAAVGLLAERFGAERYADGVEVVHLHGLSEPGGGSLPNVEIHVLTAAAAARLELAHALAYGGGSATPERKTSSLADLVDEFERLIARADVQEAEVHAFIKAHPFLLTPVAEDVLSERPFGLGTEFKADFLIRRPDATYLLVEIESPRKAVVTAGGDFAAPVEHAVRQVEDWQDWIEENLPTVQRSYPEMRAPEGLVVIGRDRPADEVQARRLRRRNINLRGRLKIITYDELIRVARAYVAAIEQHLG